MLCRKLYSSFAKNTQLHTKKPLKIDNTYQTLIPPKELNKTVLKFKRTPPEFESLHNDPVVKRYKIFSPQYFHDMTRYPDHEECLIDVKGFDWREYLKYLARSKFEDLEEKDHFPYRVLQFYILFIIHLIIREFMFGYFDTRNYSVVTAKGNNYSQKIVKDHYNYREFSKELDYHLLLFERSIQRIDGRLNID